MTNEQISQSDRDHAHTEAAIYAAGTPFTTDELFAAWIAACESAGELVSAQRVYEATLREHPEFSQDWL